MLQNVAALAAAVGVVLAALSVRAAQRQRIRQFEALYVSRYWSLMDALSLDAMKGRIDGTPRAKDEKIARSYLRLCEDECDLRLRGWIADATWKIWVEGMKETLARPPFATVWEAVKQEEKLFRNLRLLEKGAWDSRVIRPPLLVRLKAGLVGTTGV